MLPSDYVVSALADLMWSDQEDGTPGMIARGVMVRNRVVAGWHGGDWLKNIEDFNPESFSPPLDGRLVKHGDPYRDKLFIHILGQAAAIYEGRKIGDQRDMIDGALWSAKLNECTKEFAEKIVRGINHERVAQVGLRAFFK